MGLKAEFLKYLTVAKKDTKKHNKQLMDELRNRFYRKVILDTEEFAVKIAQYIDLLYYFIPEIKKADPQHIKILPLCQCCNKLAETPAKRNKPRTR